MFYLYPSLPAMERAHMVPKPINSRLAYVFVSQASHVAQILTNDAASLAESLNRDSRRLRLDFCLTYLGGSFAKRDVFLAISDLSMGGRPAKLSAKEIKTIRALLRTADISVAEIAARFGIARSTLYRTIKPAA